MAKDLNFDCYSIALISETCCNFDSGSVAIAEGFFPVMSVRYCGHQRFCRLHNSCTRFNTQHPHHIVSRSMTKKSIKASLESTFLQGGPFSADLLNSVLMNFNDELEESLHNDADDALIFVVEDARDVALLLIEWDGVVLQNEKTLERLQQMWKHNYTANMQKLIPVFLDHLKQGMLAVTGVKWIEAPV
ncbi:MAG: hypothetical protein Q7T10_09805 [Rhodoferax sp.]|uniref:hypothetical protein n=1 Tax=Rhodoferax sp. TaxID=50421 RepID=UPI00271917F0|nr:hypothetical protein [Rhodoferax sp.]MDO8449083.1 hypothetical protein [Rhodoferax sp.]